MTEYWPDFTVEEMKLMLETLESAVGDATESQRPSFERMLSKLEERIFEARLEEYRDAFGEQSPKCSSRVFHVRS